MSEQSWLVIRCPSCLQCSGHRRQKGRCPHCGSALDGTSEVVKVCTSGGELLTEVALANTPSELRDELRARLSSPSHSPPVLADVYGSFRIVFAGGLSGGRVGVPSLHSGGVSVAMISSSVSAARLPAKDRLEKNCAPG